MMACEAGGSLVARGVLRLLCAAQAGFLNTEILFMHNVAKETIGY